MVGRRLWKSLAVAGLCSFSLTAGLLADAADAKTLRFTTQLPAKNFATLNAIEFSKCVASKSDIEIQVFHSAQLYRDKEVPQAVSSGAIDMGMTTTARFAGTIPAIEILYVPFAMGTRDDIVAALAPGAKLRALLDEALLKTGARPIYWMDYGTVIFISKKNKAIRRPEDVKGKKVRVFGKTLGEFVKTLGGAPTLTSGSEQFLAYQRGTVDAGMTGIGSVKSRKLYEVMDIVARTEHAKIEFVMLINDKVWNGLSADQQKVMTECGRVSEANLRKSIAAVEEDAATHTAAQGKEVYVPTKDELKQWRKAAEPIAKAYAENSGELGKKILAILK